MINTIKKYLFLLSRKERNQSYLIVFMILIMALIDMLGIASIMPFIAVLANPDIVQTNNILNKVFIFSKIFGVENVRHFLFLLGIFFFLFLIFAISLRAFTHYIQVKFLAVREYTIGKRLVEMYLNQPYIWFLNNHSSKLNKTILSEVSKIVGKGLSPLLNLISQVCVTIAIISLLVFVNPKLTLIIGTLLFLAYVVIYSLLKNYVTKIGKDNVKANEWRFKVLSEAFLTSKEMKLKGLENFYLKKFSDPAKIISSNTASISILGQLPRFALEALTFGGMILIVLYLMSNSLEFTSIAPLIALYAFAGYRLMPALQNIYNNVIRLKFSNPSLEIIYRDLNSLKKAEIKKDEKDFELKDELKLTNIAFNYPKTSNVILKNINLSIKSCSTVGIIGKTGSGKTTLVDTILGLIEPQKGSINVDGVTINRKNLKAWQNIIGYVPQKIFLVDDTIESNIAFGVENSKIDKKAIEEVAKIANLHNFIMDELPQKYQTVIGEQGVRLSGGQQQRIGIARALYNNPKLLIMDEATSALDSETEEIIMRAVYELKKKITIILITHRLSTMEICDKLILLEKGEIKEQNSFKNK